MNNNEEKIPVNYFITCFNRVGLDKNQWLDIGCSRTFGYYEDYLTAEKALNENWCDMHETIYNYAVVEAIEPGIHPYPKERNFFKYDREKGGFFRIPEPEEFKGFCNIALG